MRSFMLSLIALACCLYAGLVAAQPKGRRARPEQRCVNSGTLAPPQKILSDVRTTFLNVIDQPNGVIYAPGYGHVAFASLTPAVGVLRPASIAVLDTSSFQPTILHQIHLPYDFRDTRPGRQTVSPAQLALSPDEHFLFVAYAYGAYVLDIARVVNNEPNALVGYLNGTTEGRFSGIGAFDVTVSSDGRYVFVAQERGPNRRELIGNIDVFRVEGGNHGKITGNSLGYLSLNQLVTSNVLSPDGTTLYATSAQDAPNVFYGTISAVDVATLERTPSAALLGEVKAGCGTIRAIVSKDGKTIWATARYDNRLLAFDAAKIISDPDNALLASVTTGTSPVGLAFNNDETRIVTADADRFDVKGATTGISVVDVKAALGGKGQKSVLGRIPTGLFPRNLQLSPKGDRILVAVHDSSQIQIIDTATLP